MRALLDEAKAAYPGASWEADALVRMVFDGPWQIELDHKGAYKASYQWKGGEVCACRRSMVEAVEAAAKRAIDPMTGRLGVALPGHDQ